ncbi:MAG: CapA family protein [Butyrivibrio sp.]
MKSRLFRYILPFILCLGILSGCAGSKTTNVNPQATKDVSANVSTEPTTEAETEPLQTEPEIEPVTINLMAIGDMLMHASASFPAVMSDGSYNYDYIFANIAGDIQAADLAVVNNEVIMAGNELGNIGYPMFNVRTELGDAEAKAGFNVILSATNHTLDQNVSGIMNCFNFWKNNHPDVSLLGIHDSFESASEITVRDVNGISVAMLNYTYGLNGLTIPEGMEYAVDLMNDSTRDKIADDISRAKEMADFVIVYPHWGTEYNMGISDEQKVWAEFFAEQGVDLVIGTHPHVVEPVEWITSSTGHKMLVYYSLGNFVSVQYYNFSMLGGMAKVSITKDSSGTYISDYDMDFLVTHYTAGRTAITTYKLDDYTNEMAASHAILTEPGEKYMEVNKGYPFTVEGLKGLAETICPELADY